MAAMDGEPPAVARQRVRRALRKAREGTPMSQGDVAKKLGWSLSKMQRIEAGEVAVSPTDLRALLDLYGITDPGDVARLAADARRSRRQRWLTPPEHRTYLTAAHRQLLQFEAQATTIRAYQSILIPGVLQTPAAAMTVLGWQDNSSITDEQRRVRYDVRMQLRRRVVEEGDGPEYFMILDEAVIKRRLGTVEVMAELLESVAEVAHRSNLHVRVLPFDQGAQTGLYTPFQLLDLSDDPEDVVAYRESIDSDEFIHDVAVIQKLRRVFDTLWEASLPEFETERRILAEAAALRN